MELWQLAVLFVVSGLLSVFSGISGGGGGFIMTPLMILLGATPAQVVSTVRIGAMAVSIGALGGMREVHGRLSKRRIIPVMVLAFVTGLIAPYIIKSLDSDVYRVLLGVILLLMIPIMLLKKIGIESYKPSRTRKYLGGVLLSVAMLLQGAFAGGLGTLVSVVLMGMLGMNATEASVTKRWSQLILSVTVVIGVFSSGLILWDAALAIVPATLVGSYFGGKIAIKKGNAFVVNTMIILMIISAVALIAGV